jgi:hypothetical protein
MGSKSYLKKEGEFLLLWMKRIIFVSMILLLSGCSIRFNTSGVEVTQEMNEAITDYILKEYKEVYPSTDKQFEAHKIYGAKESGGVTTIYLYSYYMGVNKRTKTEGQSGHSVPAVIKLNYKKGNYVVSNYKEPEDGDFFKNSLYKIFPRKYAAQVLKDTENSAGLQKEVQKKVEEWLDQ